MALSSLFFFTKPEALRPEYQDCTELYSGIWMLCCKRCRSYGWGSLNCRREMKGTAPFLRRNNVILMVWPMQLLPRITFSLHFQIGGESWEADDGHMWFGSRAWKLDFLEIVICWFAGDAEMETITTARKVKTVWKSTCGRGARSTEPWGSPRVQRRKRRCRQRSMTDRQGRFQTGNRTCLNVTAHVWVLFVSRHQLTMF